MTKIEFRILKDDYWLAASKLRPDSDLKSNDYPPPVLGIIFLMFADIKYCKFENGKKRNNAELHVLYTSAADFEKRINQNIVNLFEE